jgi:hypothetical protein
MKFTKSITVLGMDTTGLMAALAAGKLKVKTDTETENGNENNPAPVNRTFRRNRVSPYFSPETYL